jgi:DNA polymerase III epsilon subunit-like protein
MKALLIDTETTGLPISGDAYSPYQPYVIQLGGVLFDVREDKIEKSINTLILPPEGILFNERAVAVHGFSEDTVRANGRNAAEVYEELRALRLEADVVGSYNWEFDERLVRTSAVRQLGCDPDYILGVPGKDIVHHCVMKQCMAFFQHPREKLVTVYQRIMGVPLEDAHDAMADVVAAMHVMKNVFAAQLAELDMATPAVKKPGKARRRS